MTIAYIALGSNLGDRRALLDRAVATLGARPDVAVQRVSSIYETQPVGGPPGQGAYLNAAAELATTLGPDDLLHLLLDIERDLGRVRSARDGPRTIDLDIILYADVVYNDPELTLPHPRMHQRLFVLQPLAEIAPGVVHPILKKTIADLLADLLGLRSFGPSPGRELAGRRALVTGSTSGIGEAIALELASAGADVIVHGRNPAKGDEVSQRAAARGVRSSVILADLADPEQCRHLVECAWRKSDGLDIWINNGGADTLTGAARHESFEEKWRQLETVDLTATMLLSREVGRRMKAAGHGVILNMGWDQAETGMEGDSGELFAATKGAVMTFTRSLALSLAPEVRVNCLAPGWIRTAWGQTASATWQERVLRETPLKRWGHPEDVAAAARWLVSGAAAFVTGQIVRVNGGAVR
jgi:2-amino-4-hydroxy-6-hydroxymethyldihydropteridine diphosphokinase